MPWTMLRPPRAGLRAAGALMVALLAGFASAAPALAQLILPPPQQGELTDDGKGYATIHWRGLTGQNRLPDGRTVPRRPDGYRITVSLQATDEVVATLTIRHPDAENTTRGASLFPRGTFLEQRYCVTIQSFVGTGRDDGSTLSLPSQRRCAGTMPVMAPPPIQSRPANNVPTPGRPTTTDLAVTRISGPKELFDGTTGVYEVVLWNDGLPAEGTAQIQIGAIGLEPESMILVPEGFECDLGQFGFVCLGSLGGIDDPMIDRGAIFQAQFQATKTGPAKIVGSANHDRSLDEAKSDNDMMLFDVTVR